MSQDQESPAQRPSIKRPDFDAIRDPEEMILSLVGWYDGLHGLYLWAQSRLEGDKTDLKAKDDLKKYSPARYPGAHVRHAGINSGMREKTFYKNQDDTRGYHLDTKAIIELTDQLAGQGKLFKKPAQGGPMLSLKPFQQTRELDLTNMEG